MTFAEVDNQPYSGCPVSVTLEVIGGKWKGVILYHLLSGTKRYNELRRLQPEVTQRMLTLQLRELEEYGIVHREIYKQIPPRVDYSLTEFGQSLGPIIIAMKEWGERNKQAIYSVKAKCSEPKKPGGSASAGEA
ncbi:helix-turn-helix transcriptional regulator [Paenibacillus sp. HN-1]|uniref:winged helix-turn-helix transcriptional regulator n=1 Tax=Paenibacillus TaxID=44249 RepID=UPI001CA87EC1|nr:MULTISPECIES: helix-turn-helix domain-containing protein [Paenibacillus]MBY9078727.1 helix-turn-helix transcriptional regulator [Paenibacillus sp. CGMCC 1.18879]MBY9088113.1 helix-turn-helix transcriptional regulator [Paenibacillus sinensis]